MNLIQKNPVALIYGGPSPEKEISLMTMKQVAQALKDLKINFTSIEADQNLFQKLIQLKPSKAFLAVHGTYGEDGILQSMLEYLKIPYTGSGILSSALCMNKFFFKKWMIQNKILTPHFEVFSKGNSGSTPPFLPCVIKPCRSGSSLGIFICQEKSEWSKLMDLAFKLDHQVLVENYIQGQEVAVSFLDKKILTPIEIQTPQNNFYDFKRKYQSKQTRYLIPAPLDPVLDQKVKDITRQVADLCHIRSYGRADFIVSSDGEPYLLEINTLPGLTSHSLIPKSARRDGLSYSELISKILSQASLDYLA